MAIRAKIVDYNRPTSDIYGGAMGLNSLILEAQNLALPLLSGVDANYDTRFNPGQVRIIQGELEAIIRSSSEEISDDARGLLQFCEKIFEKTHQYLRFVGD